MEKVASKNIKGGLRNRNDKKLQHCSEEATMFLL